MVYYITGTLICSTILLYSLCYVTVASGYSGATNVHAHPIYKDFEKVHVAFPRRVNLHGQFISNFLPNTYKRSIHKRHSRQAPDGVIHYIVPLRDVDHHLELTPNRRFISPNMVIEDHGTLVNDRSINDVNETQCHYTGFVRGDKNSKVAISTCNGLTGYVRTKGQYFFIEPNPNHVPSYFKEQPHYVNMHILEDNFESNCETDARLEEVMAKREALRQQRSDFEVKCVNELNVETLVVVDHSMLTYHKEIDIENYVLTVFNMAHDLYHDASLNTNVNLAIVRLIRLEQEDHEMNIAINRDALKTLDYFKEWQNTINPKEDTHPNHHDIAILLTRIDICGSDNSCGLLGASKIGGMCDPHNQAAVCEDTGLRLGFVIAHEMAHTLALLHDTPEDSGCNSTFLGNLTTVMSPTISIRTGGWSLCSSKYLQLFVDSGFGKCLYDMPTEHSFTPVDMLPGVMYDGNFQCREMFGPNAALCMTGIECENLICYIEDKGCVETHTGVADGTSCGEKMWCYRGACVEVGERPTAVDGGWGVWSEWTDCSRTCGSGVAKSERYCDSPRPRNGGKYCSGDYVRHKICATEPCDITQPSFRDVQCSEFNSWVYPEDEQIHTWKNYPMPDENPCVLFCINDYGDVASLRPRVIDGTSCQRGVRDICINGLCQAIPCDLDLESNAVEDACGVCRGDSTSCDLTMGEMSIPCCGHIKEENLMMIPAKAVNIKIEEMMPTESRIQIRNCEGETVFIFGNLFGTFNVPGSLAWMGNIRTNQEAVRILGPISEPISVWGVIIENVTIRYSYGVSTDNSRKPDFYWDFVRWKRCSTECGPGIQECLPSCIEKIGGEVDEKYCKNLTKPIVQTRSCEIAPCITRWFVGDWQDCSKCPRGKRVRVVKCIRPTGTGEGEVVFVPDSQCTGTKPKHKEPCVCATTKSPRIDKRGVSADSTGHVIAEAPQQANGHTREELQIDTNGNILEKGIENMTVPEPPILDSFQMSAVPSSAVYETTGATFSTSSTVVLNITLQSNTSKVDDCRNQSLENQYAQINLTMKAPHCPVVVEYDEDLYCNHTLGNETRGNNSTNTTVSNYDEDQESLPPDFQDEETTSRRYKNISTCIFFTVTEVTNTTGTTEEMIEVDSTSETNITENVTLTDAVHVTESMYAANKNKSQEICAKLAKLIGQTALDKDELTNISLTIHTELENGKRPAGLPEPDDVEKDRTDYNVKGKEAVEFIDAMQKNFDNNKTRVK